MSGMQEDGITLVCASQELLLQLCPGLMPPAAQDWCSLVLWAAGRSHRCSLQLSLSSFHAGEYANDLHHLGKFLSFVGLSFPHFKILTIY